MKKKLSVLLSLLLAVGLMLSLAACGPGDQPDGNDQTSDLAGTYNIVMWVSELDGVKEQFADQVKAFCDANPGIVINATIEGVSESESATQMVTSVEDGADIFCFAQDQTARLVMAGALNKPGKAAADTIRANNDSGAVNAATAAGELVCFPLTSDNGYFMYYDKSVIPEDHLGSLEQIIADCEAAGKNFSFKLESSAWYNAAFFFATGCHSNWTMAADGSFTSVDDTFNSDAGLIALKGMQKLVKSKCYHDSDDGADFAAATPSAVVVTGVWALDAVKNALGDNMGTAPLPSFEVDGTSYHLGSFSGNKLMGVKPQADAKKAAVLQQLALYLTGEECQKQRFDKFGWGPSNKAVQALPEVQANGPLAALAAQSAFGTPQGQIHGSWWDIAKVISTGAKEAAMGDEAALKAVLQNYEDTINGLFSMSEETKRAFTVIGTVKSTNWDYDFPMTETAPGVWVSDEAFQFKGGEEFKCRQGLSWDVNFGDGGNNYVVSTAGTFKIQLTYTGDSGTIELIPG